jgi:putative transposase
MPTHSVLKYHIVWCTKYRRKFLTVEKQEVLKGILREKCLREGYKLEAVEVMEDHIHCFIESDVKTTVHRIVSQLKGYSSYKLKQIFPELLTRVPSIWTRSYYSGTVGFVSEDTIKKYIANQKNV